MTHWCPFVNTLTLSSKQADIPWILYNAFPDTNSNIFISFYGWNTQDQESRGAERSEATVRPESHRSPTAIATVSWCSSVLAGNDVLGRSGMISVLHSVQSQGQTFSSAPRSLNPHNTHKVPGEGHPICSRTSRGNFVVPQLQQPRADCRCELWPSHISSVPLLGRVS